MIENGSYFTDGTSLYELESQRVVQGQRNAGIMGGMTKEQRYFEMRNCKTDYLFEMDEASFKKLKQIEIERTNYDTPLTPEHADKLRADLAAWKDGPPAWFSQG